MINELTREQLLGILADETAVPLDTLRMMVFVGLGGEPSETPAPAVAPAAPAKGKGKGNAGKPPAPAKPTAATAAAGTDAMAVAMAEFAKAGIGFAIADLHTASGASKGRCKTAVKNAMAAGTLFNAGDRRFSRYGHTQAVAQVAADAARAG
jgi:hypothetical protein